MARVGVSVTAVEDAASQCLVEGIYPTAQAIREKLRQGSMTTINKHLKQWKLKRLALVPPQQQEFEEIETLKLTNQRLKAENQELTQELVSLEQNIANLIQQSQQAHAKHEETLQQLQQQQTMVEQLQSIMQAKEEGIQRFQHDKNNQIAQLRQELRDLNQCFIEEIRDTSTRLNEQLIEEKIKCLNLAEQLKQRELTIANMKNGTVTNDSEF